jgi:hypothetical protein
MKRKLRSRSASLSLYVLLGLLVFIAGLLFAVFAVSASDRIRRGETEPRASSGINAGVIGSEIGPGRAEGEPCQYTITSGADTIVPGTTDTGNHCVWCETLIPLPFPFTLYDQTFEAVNVTSSGRLDFVCNNEPANYTETCLPAPPNNCVYDYTIFALWAEWSTSTNQPGCSTWPNGCGIFTSISGSAPNRIFNIDWHVTYREGGQPGNFEVRLYENDPNKRFDVIYGAVGGVTNTYDSAGLQGPFGFFTQDFCWTSPPQNVSHTYAISLPCTTPTPTPTGDITVINTNDSGPGSLRQALADASDGDTINFDPSLNWQTIGLTSGELVIDKSTTIVGPGPNVLGVYRSSQTSFRVFHVMPGFTVTIADLTISGGDGGQQGGGGIFNDHAVLTINSCAVQNSFSGQYNNGGGIYNDGSGGSATLTILNSTVGGNAVSGNYAYSAGGGLYNDAENGGSATLTIMNSILSHNGALNEGGGIDNNDGTTTITNSIVSNNYAGAPDPFPSGYGGGVSNYGTLAITNSTINNNECWNDGGGIYNGFGTLTITGSTVTGNRADGQHDGQPWACHGGGISGAVTVTNSTLSSNLSSLYGGGIDGGGTITNSTISGNSAIVGGGISAFGGLEMANTILNNNIGANIDGTVTSEGYNISTDDGGGNLTGPGDQINTDPMLGPLQDNGGPSYTHALLPGSPAIDAGDPDFMPPPWYDQRGPNFWRVRNNRIDIGSFEVQAGPALTPTPTPTPRPTPKPRSRPAPPPRPTPR